MPIIPQQIPLLCVYTVIYTLDLHILQPLSYLNLLDPGDTWNNENRNRRLQFWPLRQLGDLHSKDITFCQNYVLSTSELFFFKRLLPGVILSTCQNYGFPDESSKNLMAVLDLTIVTTLYWSAPTSSCPLEISLWFGKNLMAGCETELSPSSWESESNDLVRMQSHPAS